MPSPSKELASLAARIEQVRGEAERFIDDRAEDLRREVPGVPIGVLRLQIVAGMKNCPCAAILNLHFKETQQ